MTDIVVTPADVRPLPGATMFRGVAGAALNVGESVYKHSTTNQWRKTDASAASTAKARGVVVSAPNGALAAVAGDAIDIVTEGPVAGFASMTPGAVEYVSETAGAIADAAPSTAAAVVWAMGWAMTAAVLYVNPGNEVVPGSAIASLTDNSGGSANDTLTALGGLTTLTDSTGQSGTHDDTLAAQTTQADLTGGESPTEAEFNTLLAEVRVIAQNVSDVGQKAIEVVADIEDAKNNFADLAAKVNAILAALRAQGIIAN